MQPDDIPINNPQDQPGLPEDGSTPATPAPTGNTPDDQRPAVSSDDPQSDSRPDAAEAYDVGIGTASGAELPRNDGVVDYEPQDPIADTE